MAILLPDSLKQINGLNFPIIDDVDVKGSLQTVATILDMNNIGKESRKPGMLVYVIATGLYYKLANDNITFTEFKSVINTADKYIFNCGGASK